MYQIILIERYLPSSFLANLVKSKRIAELTVEQILYKYQGFEGELIDRFLIGDDEIELKKIILKCLEIKNSNNYFMLHVFSGSETVPQYSRDQTIQVGYDVGVCQKDLEFIHHYLMKYYLVILKNWLSIKIF